MIAAIAAWWRTRRDRRCSGGHHRWTLMSDQLRCKHCLQRYYA